MATSNVTNASNPSAALFSSSNETSASKTSAADDMEERFLTLLMTQLKNQDPLNPTDANQMTAQLSQISTVSGIEKLNASMEKLLASYSETQNMQAAAIIGKTVLAAGNTLELGADGAIAGVNLEGSAERVTISIRDAAGKVVQTQELGKQASGVMSFMWDGQSDAGADLPAGNYTFSVDAGNGDTAVKSATLAAGTVSALSLTKEGVLLQLPNNKSVAYGDILQIMN